MSGRSTRQIARDALRGAQEQGIIERFAVRDGGRATIYPTGTRTKLYTTGALDTLTELRRLGFKPGDDS